MEYYIANVSFSGKISMYEGEVRQLSGKTLIKDLTKANYIRKLSKKEVEAMMVLGMIKENRSISETDNEDEQIPEIGNEDNTTEQEDSQIDEVLNEDVMTDENE